MHKGKKYPLKICKNDIIGAQEVFMLRRKFYDTLLKWSKEKNQECLLVRGARQIGKTYIIDYFGRKKL